MVIDHRTAPPVNESAPSEMPADSAATGSISAAVALPELPDCDAPPRSSGGATEPWSDERAPSAPSDWSTSGLTNGGSGTSRLKSESGNIPGPNKYTRVSQSLGEISNG